MRNLTLPSFIMAVSITIAGHAQTNYDARIDSYVGLRYPCDGSVQPVLRIRNMGGNTMTSCDIDVLKNGVANDTFHWILSSPAATGETRQPALTTMAGVQPGDVLEFHILTVNAQPDEDPDGNNITIPLSDAKGDAGSYIAQVRILTDDAPNETTWTITNALGAVVASGGPYTDANTEQVINVVLSATQCYNFQVFDSGNNGLAGTRAAGYAKLLSLGQEVVNIGGSDFTSSYRKGVQTGAANGCIPSQLTTTATPLVSCGAMGLHLNGTNTLWASEVAGANKYQFRFTNVAGQPAYTRNITSPSRSLTLTQWATLPLKRGRSYNVQVRASFDNGVTYCPFSTSCAIGISNTPSEQERMSDDAADPFVDPTITLFPDPLTDGPLHIILSNTGIDNEPVNVEVYDAFGRMVAASRPIVESDDVPVEVAIDHTLSAGLYIVNVGFGGTNLTQRLLVR